LHPSLADSDWLDAAARLAVRGRPLSRPNPAVGAIIVNHGVVVGRGWTQPGGRPHAEAMALDQAGDRARGAIAYITLEPCAHRSQRGPACADRLIESGVARVVAGIRDPDPRTAGQGLERLRAAGIDARDADHAASRRSLAGYLARTELRRPHVTLKLAVTLDGAISLADRDQRWITGEVARAHVHSRRAQADAILVGGGTWRSDAPALDVRLPGLEGRSPERWVLTSHPVESAQTIPFPAAIGTMEGVQYLYVEGGAVTAAGFLAEDLVDRLELYRAPIDSGGGRDVLAYIGLGDLGSGQPRWRLVDSRQLGSDTFTAYERARCSPGS
jgi:diaminohydroxyphosphoribosylaminopyrimidine deaminase/5-amino-6-(5-phosphoribosylamino)uracil reductase